MEASPSGRWQRFAKPRPERVSWVRIPPPPLEHQNKEDTILRVTLLLC
ncbi:MAG: hypothetical protein UX04_C0002G0086 [Microgenomates group bacterium GW2011_GWF2_45_18]|nr:MAG: hypothetical protein UW18_C0001G0011 [Microgenomates group bacterium GW2011_GWF1_44_10]KKU01943.1 MAG: hypothetical protein UX04_C0002G0086 [Microgenomates group bacterium GW2011_GWF2_45_18]